MNLSVFSLLTSVFQVLAVGAAAQTITLSEKRSALIHVLDKIAGQSGFYFLYDDESIQQAEPVTIEIKDAALDEALKKLFAATPFNYTKKGKTIVIKALPTPRVPESRSRSQDRIVSGQVVDEAGNPVAGVTVTVKGKAAAVTTNEDGRYQISVSDDSAVLVFTNIGFETVEQPVSNQTTLDIRMDFAISDLDEVVVVGMNITQSKRSVTGSVATIQTKELKQSPVANLNNALAGRLPGLISVQNSGQPGNDAAQLYIRGISTYGGNTAPLIVIDGLPRSAESFSNIDPNEVESISILKDATSSALYGIQGANGVVVVTTKRGKVNETPQINATSQYALQAPVRLPKNMTSYELALYSNKVDINNGNSPRFDDEALHIVQNNLSPYLYPNVNWFDEILRSNTPQFMQNLNISGSTSRVRYFVSGSYLNQGTLLKYDDIFFENYGVKSTYDRYNFRSNVDIEATKLLTVQVDLAGRLEKRVGPGQGFNKVFSDLSGMLPYAMPVFNPDGTLGAASNVEIPFWTNPYGAVTQHGYYSNFTNVMYGTLSAQHKLDFIVPGLSARGNFSFENNNFKGTSRIQDFDTYWYRGYDNVGNEVYQRQMRESRINTSGTSSIERTNYLDLRLVYDTQLGDHTLGAQLMGNRTLRVLNDELPYAYQGISARTTYNFKSRYYAELNFAYNGSENFPPDRRYGFFPSASAGWIVSDEAFFPAESFVDYLKIRGSFGIVGNDKSGNDRWLYLSDYANAGGYRIGVNNATKPGFTEGRVGNGFVTWEKARKANIGFETAVLRNSLYLVFDVFQEHRTDILTYPGTIPAYVGIANLAPRNSGEVRNRGMDMELRYQKRLGDLRVFSNFTFTYTQNEVLKNDQPNPAYPYQNLIGYPVGYQLGYRAIGFFKDEHDVLISPKQNFDNKNIPGDLKFMDINGDGVVDPFDRVPIQVHNIPNYMMGLSLGFDYKGFDASLLLNGALGTLKFSRPRTADPLANYTWTEELGDGALMPVAKTSSNNELLSDFWVRPSDYMKLRNAEIGYTLPSALVNRVKLKHVRFFLNGQNLAMWDNAWVKDRDPETNGGAFVYPVQRVINFGLNLGI
ncbi:TonB-dependent receptor [Parapedobacter deserti]|uniref:TonB-dependent receptor n=1 Tax=Parapedobacter deserti TaxID=1912957 RepID=A0ABV7JSZ4_9SPHI